MAEDIDELKETIRKLKAEIILLKSRMNDYLLDLKYFEEVRKKLVKKINDKERQHDKR